MQHPEEYFYIYAAPRGRRNMGRSIMRCRDQEQLKQARNGSVGSYLEVDDDDDDDDATKLCSLN